MLPTFVFVTLFISQALSQPQDAQSCEGTQPLITGNVLRVENNQITASSSYSNEYLPHHVRLGSNSWCPQSGQGDNSWIQVDFGTIVTICELQIGGFESDVILIGNFFDSHLTRFEVEYGVNSTQTIVLTRDDTPDVRTIVLPAPIATRVLRITSIEYKGSVPCVLLEAIGCLQSPSCEVDELLSSNRSLLPLSSITASSSTSGDPAEDVTTTGWCSSQSFDMAQPTPYIVFNFTRSVVLTYMTAEGQPSQYVRQFSLDYKRQYTDSYTSYTLLSEEEAIFTSEGSSSQTYTFWRQPVQGVTFRFKIRDGQRSDGVFCWGVQLYGCTVEEQDDVSVTPTSVTSISVTSTMDTATAQTLSDLSTFVVTMETPLFIPTSMVTVEIHTTTPTTANISNVGASVAAIAGGVVGGIIILSFLLFLIVLLVVCLLVTQRSKNKRYRLSTDNKPANEDLVAYSKTGSVRIVDNDLYGVETPPTSPTDNEFGIPSEPNPNTYESLKSPATAAIDLANTATYATIASPKVKATNTAETYESVGSPLVYSYAAVDAPVKVALPGNSTTMGSSEPIELVSGKDSFEGVDVQCGSMVDNALYQRADYSQDRTKPVENLMYGDVGTVVNKELINNPLYESM